MRVPDKVSDQRGSILLILILVILLVVLAGSITYFLTNQNSSTNNISPSSTSPTIAEKSNQKQYTNKTWGISFNYPQVWQIKTYGNDPTAPVALELTNNLSPMIKVVYHNNPANLSLQDFDKESERFDQERSTGVSTPKLTPLNYETVNLPNKDHDSAYYVKDAFCEPSTCQKYIFIKNQRIIEIVIDSAALQMPNFQSDLDQFISSLQFTN